MIGEKVPQRSFASLRDGPHRKTDIVGVEQIAFLAQRTEFIDQILCPLGCGYITLDEYLVPPGADGNTEGLFDKFEVPGETSVEEREFLFGVKIYLCSDRNRSFLFLCGDKGIQAFGLLQFERKYRSFLLAFEFAGSHLVENHSFGTRFFLDRCFDLP